MNLPHIILYQGGSGGDMLSAIIDNRDYYFDGNLFRLHNFDRIKLRNRKYVKGMTDIDRDMYIQETTYKSLASHQLNYHIDRKHRYIHIDCSDPMMAKWIINRFHKLYDGEDWYQRTQPDSILNWAKRASEHAYLNIDLRDILNGKLIEILKPHVDTPLNSVLYESWLAAILNKNPIDNK